MGLEKGDSGGAKGWRTRVRLEKVVGDGELRVELELMKEHVKMRDNSRLEGRRWRKEGEVGGGEMLEH